MAVDLAIELAEEDLNTSKAVASQQKGYVTELGIFVATPDEFNALLPFISESANVPHSDEDMSSYVTGFFVKGKVKKSIVVTTLPFMGMQAAGIAAAKMILNYSPKYLIMVGHAAGNKDVAGLGDILVAETSLD